MNAKSDHQDIQWYRVREIHVALAILLIVSVLFVKLDSSAAQPASCSLNLNPPRNIDAESFYVDHKGSVPDQQIVERNRLSLQVLDGAIYQVDVKSNAFLAARNESDAQCAMAMLGIFAKRTAMLGALSSSQATVERLWRATGLGVIYYTERQYSDKADMIQIDSWLQTLAVATGDNFVSAVNNLRCWVGLLEYAVGRATGNVSLLQKGLSHYRESLRAITPEGYLPEEMKRGQMALHYHNFALAPLVILAEIGERLGDHLYEDEGGAIHRLAQRVCADALDPGSFAPDAGPQRPEGLQSLVWLPFYSSRFPHRLNCKNGEFVYKNPALGGNLDLLASYWREKN